MSKERLKKSNVVTNVLTDVLKVYKKKSRDEEIKKYGSQISFRSKIQSSKKLYKRREKVEMDE